MDTSGNVAAFSTQDATEISMQAAPWQQPIRALSVSADQVLLSLLKMTLSVSTGYIAILLPPALDRIHCDPASHLLSERPQGG